MNAERCICWMAFMEAPPLLMIPVLIHKETMIAFIRKIPALLRFKRRPLNTGMHILLTGMPVCMDSLLQRTV